MVLMLALSNIVGQGVKLIQLLVDTWAMKKNESENLKKIPYLWVKCGILLVTLSDKSESDRSKYFLFKLVDIAILCTFMH